jgi:hypothetical protein
VKLVRCCHSVEVLFHYVHMRLMVILNYDYLEVKMMILKMVDCFTLYV